MPTFHKVYDNYQIEVEGYTKKCEGEKYKSGCSQRILDFVASAIYIVLYRRYWTD